MPIIGVSITSGRDPYDFAESLHFMTHLIQVSSGDTGKVHARR